MCLISCNWLASLKPCAQGDAARRLTGSPTITPSISSGIWAQDADIQDLSAEAGNHIIENSLLCLLNLVYGIQERHRPLNASQAAHTVLQFPSALPAPFCMWLASCIPLHAGALLLLPPTAPTASGKGRFMCHMVAPAVITRLPPLWLRHSCQQKYRRLGIFARRSQTVGQKPPT